MAISTSAFIKDESSLKSLFELTLSLNNLFDKQDDSLFANT